MSQRTFKITSPLMQGSDIRAWQIHINDVIRKWDMDMRLDVDGIYGPGTRSVTASVLHGMGYTAGHLMRNGITPWLRTKVRNRRRTAREQARFIARVGWRRRLRRRWAQRNVAPITAKVLADSWGWVPGVHDGIDIITPPRAPVMAPVDSVVVRVSPGGWWGKAPSGDVRLGDGIVIIRSKVNSGPIRKGMNLCYGHCENATVKVGDEVKAGEMIGRAGLAVAWHIHFMVNNRNDTRGTGDRNPRPVYEYAQKSR